MKPIYIASCSFGKDSIATILLALENNEPLDRVVFAEVMFDNERGISGEIPEHIEWVRSTAIPKVVRGGVYKGKIYGFPIGGKCFINRDCKVTPIRRYLAKLAGGSHRVRKNIVQYIGIAKDEPSRLGRIARVELHAQPLLLRLQVGQDISRGGGEARLG